MIKNNEFNKIFPTGVKLPQIDTIRGTLKVINMNGLIQMNLHIVKKAK